MVRRINQQFKYDPIAHVGASGLVYTAKTRLKVVSDDPIVYVIEQSRLLSDGNRGSVSKEKYAERIRAEATTLSQESKSTTANRIKWVNTDSTSLRR